MTAIPAFITPAGLERQHGPEDTQKTRLEEAKQHAREQAEEFESVFLHMFVEQMFSGIETEGPFTGGSAEETYRSMMSQEYSKSLASNGGIGLADHVYAEILKGQEIEP